MFPQGSQYKATLKYFLLVLGIYTYTHTGNIYLKKKKVGYIARKYVYLRFTACSAKLYFSILSKLFGVSCLFACFLILSMWHTDPSSLCL